MSKIWSPENTKELIHEYECHEVLWNIKLVDYRNREKKSLIFRQLGEKFECSASEIQRKIHNLRNQMSQELKKIKQAKSGSGTDEVYCSKWPYFTGLKFLISSLVASSTQSNLEKIASNTSKEISQISDNENIIEASGSKEEDIKTKIENKRKLNRSSKRKYEIEEEESAFNTAMKILKKEPDEFDIFGEYVAQELRSLKSEFLKRKLKSEIRRAIVHIADEDLYSYSSTQSIVPSPYPTNISSSSEQSRCSPINLDLQSTEDSQSTTNYIEHFHFQNL